MVLEALRKLPDPIKKIIRPFGSRLVRKGVAELSYWKSKHRAEGGRFNNSHYENLMLAMAEETNDDFLTGKVVADFGCGPRGSLVWAKSASMRFGIDVLAQCYAETFPEDIIEHKMVYVASTEKLIPLPSNFLDVMFSLNALDHVDSFEEMCAEIIRVLKSGGLFLGSFNLGERPTATEPQELTVKRVKVALLSSMRLISSRVANQGPRGDVYRPLLEGNLEYDPGKQGILWVKAEKP